MTGVRKAICVLIVEDSPDDAELLTLDLANGGYLPDVVCVEMLEDRARAR